MGVAEGSKRLEGCGRGEGKIKGVWQRGGED